MMMDQTVEFTTHSGFKFLARPARPEDEKSLQEFFQHVTPEDRRFRFLDSVRQLSHERLEAMTDVDQQRVESFVAFESRGGPIIASAMLACDDKLDTCEVAISIHSEHKHRGVSWELLGFLTRRAEAKGIKRLQSLEDRSNTTATNLEHEMGFISKPYPDEPELVILEK